MACDVKYIIILQLMETGKHLPKFTKINKYMGDACAPGFKNGTWAGDCPIYPIWAHKYIIAT